MHTSLVSHRPEVAEGTVERPKLAAEVIWILSDRIIVKGTPGLASISVGVAVGICVRPVHVFAP